MLNRSRATAAYLCLYHDRVRHRVDVVEEQQWQQYLGSSKSKSRKAKAQAEQKQKQPSPGMQQHARPKNVAKLHFGHEYAVRVWCFAVVFWISLYNGQCYASFIHTIPDTHQTSRLAGGLYGFDRRWPLQAQFHQHQRGNSFALHKTKNGTAGAGYNNPFSTPPTSQ
jgi:hypothetical protein